MQLELGHSRLCSCLRTQPKMVPADVLEECRQARLAAVQPRRRNWIAGGIILILWLAAIVAVVIYLRRRLSD